VQISSAVNATSITTHSFSFLHAAARNDVTIPTNVPSKLCPYTAVQLPKYTHTLVAWLCVTSLVLCIKSTCVCFCGRRTTSNLQLIYCTEVPQSLPTRHGLIILRKFQLNYKQS